MCKDKNPKVKACPGACVQAVTSEVAVQSLWRNKDKGRAALGATVHPVWRQSRRQQTVEINIPSRFINQKLVLLRGCRLTLVPSEKERRRFRSAKYTTATHIPSTKSFMHRKIKTQPILET